MMEAGMNIAFLNMSFGSRDEHIESIKMLRQAATNYSTTAGKVYPLAIAIRLTGRKIRTGRIADVRIVSNFFNYIFLLQGKVKYMREYIFINIHIVLFGNPSENML